MLTVLSARPASQKCLQEAPKSGYYQDLCTGLDPLQYTCISLLSSNYITNESEMPAYTYRHVRAVRESKNPGGRFDRMRECKFLA